MTTIEVALIIIAVAFAALVIFLAFLITCIIQSVKRTNAILDQVQKQVQDLGNEPAILLQRVNQLSENLNEKMLCLDPLFRVVSNLGSGLECKTSALKERMLLDALKEKFNSEEEKKECLYEDLAECAALGIKMWNKFKK